jgi:signal transduction histidine kinase
MAVDNARLYRDLGLLAASEQTRAAELQAVIGAMGDAVIVADGIGRVVLSNPAAQELLPERALEDVPSLLEELVGDDGRRPRLVSLEREGARELQLRASSRWVSVAAYGVPGKPHAVAAASEVASVRRSATSTRASTILILRDVTAERQARNLQETFVGVLSHELRTPITTIYGGSRMLQRERSGLTDDMRRELLGDISVEADRLHRLTEDLLVLTRLERGGVVIASEPILLQRVIPEVVRAESGRSPDHTFALEIAPGLPPVKGELTYVEQVVRNLVSNAAKYSPPGSTVLITALDAADEIEVQVCDEGSGIDPDESEQLFELLYRSDAVVREVSGAGIGLFVCRSLLDAMGGRVWADNRPNGGAAFAFRLPIYAET